jgi:uncharacterized protein (TIGR00251 family)
MIKLLVKVKPGSGKDEISVDAENNFSIKITAKPIDGEANDYLVNFLAKEFNISKGRIQIEKGAISRLKRIALAIEQSALDALIKKYKV